MPLIDITQPIYRPLWLRFSITAACLGWAGVEVLGGNLGWAMLFGAIGAYAGWKFFVEWPPKDDAGEGGEG